MPRSLVGSRIKRTEDRRLLTGRGLFVDDFQPAGCLHAAFVRSPLAHARVAGLDLKPALARRGVRAAFSAEDLRLPSRLSLAVLDEAFARPPLAANVVRFVGEAVAVVVGDSRAAAADGAEAVAVEYERLPVVARPGQEEPLLFPERGSNLAFKVEFGSRDDLAADADVIVRAAFTNQRVAAVPLEPNAVLAAPEEQAGGLRLWASTQSPFQVRDFVADCLGLPEASVRCTAPDVGGGFGAKLPVYPEQVVVAALAIRLGRPVRWVETRTESFLAMCHGRGQAQEVELAATSAGRLEGLRVRVTADAGAYPGSGAFLPYVTGEMVSGVYDIPAIAYQGEAWVTNTTPIASYRGAGRPEATTLLERAIDMLAFELRLDPAELRRRNLVPPERFPHTTATGATYDSGNYPAALNRALELAGYGELREEQRRRRQSGARRLLGIGLSCYVERTVIGSPTEYASVEAGADGGVAVRVGTASNGQGHETAYAQIAAETLGVPIAAVHVLQGDTGLVPRGDGTSGSRSLQLGGSAVLTAAQSLLASAREGAAAKLEADPDDLVPVGDGRLAVRGAPGSALTYADLAREAGAPLRGEADFTAADAAYPFGCHLAVAEVDADTGEARLIRHVAVDDCGPRLNPALVEGQIHGGIAQGAAQALFEEIVYDGEANPLTSSLLDYALPTANELPSIETASTVTPSPHNPLGVKGAGESGTIGATAAVQNAVIDALGHLGVRHLDMPLGPERLWRAIRDSRRP